MLALLLYSFLQDHYCTDSSAYSVRRTKTLGTASPTSVRGVSTDTCTAFEDNVIFSHASLTFLPLVLKCHFIFGQSAIHHSSTMLEPCLESFILYYDKPWVFFCESATDYTNGRERSNSDVSLWNDSDRTPFKQFTQNTEIPTAFSRFIVMAQPLEVKASRLLWDIERFDSTLICGNVASLRTEKYSLCPQLCLTLNRYLSQHCRCSSFYKCSWAGR